MEGEQIAQLISGYIDIILRKVPFAFLAVSVVSTFKFECKDVVCAILLTSKVSHDVIKNVLYFLKAVLEAAGAPQSS